MAVVGGDLRSALSNARHWRDAAGVSSNARFRGEPLLQLIYLLLELGQNEEARSLALSGLREQRGWVEDDLTDTQIELPRAAYVTGAIDANQYRQSRDAWLMRHKRPIEEVWVKAYAGLSIVGTDMEIPVHKGEYALDWIQMSPEYFARAANELGRFGRNEESIEHAESAAACCLAFSAVGNLHAQIELATAYDRAGSASKACAAYAALITRYGTKSKSVSVNYARRRITSLSCRQVDNNLAK
jgi:hypothetical protein